MLSFLNNKKNKISREKLHLDLKKLVLGPKQLTQVELFKFISIFKKLNQTLRFQQIDFFN